MLGVFILTLAVNFRVSFLLGLKGAMRLHIYTRTNAQKPQNLLKIANQS